MATNYPASADDSTSLPDPTATSKTNSPSHSSLHANANGAIKAIEAKLGTGASTPVANRLLFGNGTGTSTWAQLSSAQLAASLSDETGSGSAVFATSPTLVTPLVNTINEATAANGVTIDGLNIKDGALNTSNSVVTNNVTNGAITASKISLGPQTTYLATDQGTASISYTDLATVQSVTVTIGTNGLALAFFSAGIYNVAVAKRVSVAVSGASTVAASDDWSIRNDTATFAGQQGTHYLFTGLTAGSNTFTLKFKTSSGTANFFERRLTVIPL